MWMDKAFLREKMMGPNCVRILEELVAGIPLRQEMRLLDLGCGKGLTSLFLAERFGATVFATDLWISATENLRRFAQRGMADKVIPIHADAQALPYGEGFFEGLY
jgi:cyclopropane fatty-acyl-phospholipid synthase-like methyltransferase